MAQPLIQATTPARSREVRLGVQIELVTILWMTIEASVALVYFLVREGREALQEARTGETCQCGDEECCDD